MSTETIRKIGAIKNVASVFNLSMVISCVITYSKIVIINVYIGYSLLQGGPLPCFFSERQLQTFFTEDQEKTEMEEQFVQGIASFGLPLVCKELLNIKNFLRIALYIYVNFNYS